MFRKYINKPIQISSLKSPLDIYEAIKDANTAAVKKYIAQRDLDLHFFNLLSLILYLEPINLRLLELLLINGGSRFIANKNLINETLLHSAAKKGSSEAIYLLLEHGAHLVVNNPDIFGQTPLVLALRSGDINSCKLLLRAGADPRLISDEQLEKCMPNIRSLIIKARLLVGMQQKGVITQSEFLLYID